MVQKIALIITGVLIGLLTMSQYQSVPLGPFRDQYQPDTDREAILQDLNQEQERLKDRVTELRNEIQKAQQSNGSSESEQIRKLQELELKNGLTAVKGKGITILLDDSQEAKRAFLDVNDNALVHAADLRDVTNLLFAYGATAIAINGERVINTSPIVCVGNNILVNHANMVPPFRIDALGPAEKLYLNLLNTEQLPALYGRKEAYGLQFSIRVEDNLEIPLYGGNLFIDQLKEASKEQISSPQ